MCVRGWCRAAHIAHRRLRKGAEAFVGVARARRPTPGEVVAKGRGRSLDAGALELHQGLAHERRAGAAVFVIGQERLAGVHFGLHAGLGVAGGVEVFIELGGFGA